MNRIINKYLLIAAYIVMLVLCVVFNFTSDQEIDVFSIGINVVMFLIVGIIFVWAIRDSLDKISKISSDLAIAAMKIKSDADDGNGYLWDQYKNNDATALFKQDDLVNTYNDYLKEVRRLEDASSSGYRCSIEDYINQEMINTTAKKNLLNIIPGAMTGMGILGTFVGLSMGLQEFNTGTSAEIESSIAPLMNGIKVAFHTSVYGMVFSLVFNFVYKNILEDAYNNLEYFLDAYTQHVCPDTENERFRQLLDSQQKQSEVVVYPLLNAIQSMNDNLTNMLNLQRVQYKELRKMPEDLGKNIESLITPQFAKMNDTLDAFADRVSQTQMMGMGELIDKFVSQMNNSLMDSFSNLSKIIDETCDIQKQNNSYMQDIMSRVGNMILDIQKIDEMSTQTIRSLSEYIQEVEKLQSIINQNFMSVNLQLDQNNKMEEKQQAYIAELVEYEKKIGEASEKFTLDMAAQIVVLEKLEKEISSSTRENLEIISTKANEYSESLTKTTKEQMQNVLTLTDDFKNRVSKQIDLVTQQAETQNAAIANAAKQEIQTILKLSSSTSGEMDRATQELSTVYKQLNGQVQQSLNSTFDLFDQELSEIAKHLSGTIAEVDSTTGRVPKVVASAYEDMGKSFAEMQKEMQLMINMMETMQHNMTAAMEKTNEEK